MTAPAVVTRFAPSPSGELHMGNVRTALFSLLLARHAGGRFILRIEDTDAARSTAEHTAALLTDLAWLGLAWDEGPDCGGPAGPYLQSQRGSLYEPLLARLDAEGHAYPCYCTPGELELERAVQRQANLPPRYSGKCAGLDARARAALAAEGRHATLRFRVPHGRHILFRDLVHGEQDFDGDLIGDFVIRRDDGTPAFFFANAIDDALMGVTRVLRGEDHLANTPRQLLILEALGLPQPGYGHLALLTGEDGAPLSKRNGARSLRELREAGYAPEAICNLLFRLGHSTPVNAMLPLEGMAAFFDVKHLQRASARFDEVQLRHWQSLWLRGLETEAALSWLGPRLPATLAGTRRELFVAAVLPNLTVANDIDAWLPVALGGPLAIETPAAEAQRAAGRGFYEAALSAVALAEANGMPLTVDALRAATGRKGAQFFAPLRAALTGRLHGPELGPLLAALPVTLVRARLAAALEG